MSNLSPHQFPTQSVPATQVPVEDSKYRYPKGSFAVAEDDHPAHYFGNTEGTYTLRHQPVDKIPYGPEEEWDDVDWRSVKTMAKQLKDDPDHHTPALISFHDGEGLAGGNHRTEAYRRAGRPTIPVWERDN
jgi:hypothetical protein